MYRPCTEIKWNNINCCLIVVFGNEESGFLPLQRDIPRLVHFRNSLNNLLKLIPGLPSSLQELPSKRQAQASPFSPKLGSGAAAPHEDSSLSTSTTPEPSRHLAPTQRRSYWEEQWTWTNFTIYPMAPAKQSSLGLLPACSDAVKLTSKQNFKMYFIPLIQNSLLSSSTLKRFQSCSCAGWPHIIQIAIQGHT